MKRIQLYLDEQLWKVLHIRSLQQGTSISDLLRQAIGEKYGNSSADRRQAMQSIVGVWKEREDLPGPTAYVRRIRKCTRS